MSEAPVLQGDDLFLPEFADAYLRHSFTAVDELTTDSTTNGFILCLVHECILL
jgi:hypothetical protein